MGPVPKLTAYEKTYCIYIYKTPFREKEYAFKC